MNSTDLRVASPPSRPLLVWDGDCRFCGLWVRRWNAMTGEAVDYEPYQEVGNRFPEIQATDYAKEIHLILPDGRVFRAAAAVFQTLALGTGHGGWQWLYQKLPGFAPITEFFYRRVASNRSTLSLLTKIFWGDPSVRSTFCFSGMLFLRLLGLVFLVAFISFWGQSAGLVGDHGIIPEKLYFDSIKAMPGLSGFEQFMRAPSLLWLSPDSAGLNAIMGTGVACSLLMMMGLLPGWALLGCVITYGSLRGGVPIFLDFQWDILLVETGFVALLMVPWGWWQRPWSPRDPPKIGRWSLWWLLFKLMFLSGLVKLLWNGNGPGPANPNWFRQIISKITDVPIGNNTWLDGTALQFHYFTQPIPAATSWWFNNRPAWFQSTSLWTCMAIELIVPFLFFAPRRLRHIAALLQIFLQVMIMLSGNFGFFNLLTIVLCLLLLDDSFWPKRVQRLLQPRTNKKPVRASIPANALFSRTGTILRATLAGFVLVMGLVLIWETWEDRTRDKPLEPHQPNFLESAANNMQKLGLVDSYGLFRVMTTERPEIILEGSDDGQKWREYEFVWKPGDPMREPSFTTPHMPRLDWQMWFAALEIYESRGTSIPQWLELFADQLKAGNPNVLALLDNNPFPKGPPKQVRLRLYLYKFATPEEHEKTGAWWTRTLIAG
ncbi:MAG TPA: lipase maturation factor family protein [Opitutales bacterium]|jgi:predicted DCC family thiol-disulfide oxidoreductase YuxK|nr:lipase maturation factor family protein [Opitutales bacterium]